MRQVFFQGLLAGVLAGLASFGYRYAYNAALLVDFSAVMSTTAIFASSILGSLVASLGYWFFSKWVRSNTDVWFNLIFLLLTFATLVGSFSASLPPDIESPELFPGLSVPTHFFPILFWLAVKPLFKGKEY